MWAIRDCKTARFAYRVKFNIPRVPIDQTDDLTEHEFDYELLLHHEYHQGIIYADQDDPLSLTGTGGTKDMRTDPVLYQELKQKLESGEDINYLLPDESEVPRLSQKLAQRQVDQEEQVDPKQVFGGAV